MYIRWQHTTKIIKTPGQILLSVQSNATVLSVDLGNPSVEKDNLRLTFVSQEVPFSFLSRASARWRSSNYVTKQTKTGKNSFAIFVLIIKYIHIKYMRAYIHTLFVNAGWGWQPEADVNLPPNIKKSDFGQKKSAFKKCKSLWSSFQLSIEKSNLVTILASHSFALWLAKILYATSRSLFPAIGTRYKYLL